MREQTYLYSQKFLCTHSKRADQVLVFKELTVDRKSGSHPVTKRQTHLEVYMGALKEQHPVPRE